MEYKLRTFGLSCGKARPCNVLDRELSFIMLRVRNLHRPGLPHFGPFDLDLEAGTCVALSGLSGVGKSLFLRAIADLDPNLGSVSLDGESREEIPAPLWRRRVTYLAAEPGWWDDTPLSHFTDPLMARALLPRLALPLETLDWPVARLSTGERQRLALLRVLMQTPRVMLLDEPTAALDPEATAAVETVIRERCENGTAILFTTHDRAQACRLGDRRLMLEKGGLREAEAA